MITFIEPNNQAIIGSKTLLKKVISGPRHIFLFIGQRIHYQISTIPRWSTFTSQELPTITQVPVVFEIACNWSRNLIGLTDQQLFAAVDISNNCLEIILQKTLDVATKYYASFYSVDDLVATPETDNRQQTLIKRNHRHLIDCIQDDIRKQLGDLGLVVNRLNLNISLPAHLQKEIEDMWRLQKHQGHIADLTNLKLSRAIANGQPIIELIAGSLKGENLDDNRIPESVEERLFQERFKRNGHSKKKL